MPRSLHLPWLLLTSVMIGCQASGSIAIVPGRFTNQPVGKKTTGEPFASNDSLENRNVEENQRTLAKVDHALVKQMIAEAPVGAQVSVVIDSGRQYSGILRKSDGEGLELMNSVGKEVIPGPEGQKQCKTSHVPFQSFKIASITRFLVISPPAPGSPSTYGKNDSRCVTVSEIVYKDGRHQRLGGPAPSEPIGSSER